MNFRILAAAGAAVLISAGVALAQGATTTTTAPAVTHSTTAHSATTHTAATASSGEAVSCHSSHAVGSACGCKKAPGRHGTVAAGANGGHNMCQVPAAAAAAQHG